MAAGGYFSILDRTEDDPASTFSFNTGAITALTIAAVLTQFGALRTAVDAIINGVITEEGLTAFRTRLSNVRPTSQEAQREKKWLIRYEDSTPFFDPGIDAIPNAGYRKVFTSEIPTADLTAVLLIDGTDRADLTDAPMSDFVTAFEALCKSPYGGAVNVLGVEFVGRNN